MRLLALALLVLAAGSGVAVVDDDAGVAVGSKRADSTGDLQVDGYSVVWNGSNATAVDVVVNNTASMDLQANVAVELRTLDGETVASASETVLLGMAAEEVRVSFAAEHPPWSFSRVRVRVEKTL